MNILTFLAISVIFNLIVFILAFKFRTDKLTDISYALTFIFLILLGFFINEYDIWKLILILMVLLWAFRLGIYVLIRINKIGKDKRFDKIRNNFYKFLGFCLLQGISVWIILIPSLFFLFSEINFTFVSFVGIIIWFLGFLIESISDYQKFNFNKKYSGKFISTGLWKYSRHPNYFGEILCWIGIYLFVFSSLSLIEGIISLIGPIFIIILLVFVSGIPKLENLSDKRWKNDKKYWEYKRKTSILVPWFPKKSALNLLK